MSNEKITVKQARKAMSIAMKENGFRMTYKANIAMCIYDNRRKDGRLNVHDCNDIAEKIIELIFDSKSG